MTINTASAIISLAKKLEENGAGFYEKLAQKYPTDRDVFLTFSNENQKNITQIDRTYYSVITDALEGCFAFHMKPDKYVLATELPARTSFSGTVNKALEIEKKTIQFYLEAAEQSKSLMADLHRAFIVIVKKRSNRKLRLEALVGNKLSSRCSRSVKSTSARVRTLRR